MKKENSLKLVSNFSVKLIFAIVVQIVKSFLNTIIGLIIGAFTAVLANIIQSLILAHRMPVDWDGDPNSGYIFFGALIHEIFIGLPLYLILRKFCPVRWWMALVCGFLVGTLPIFILTVTFSNVSKVDEFVEALGGLCGVTGGFTAWVIWENKLFKKTHAATGTP